MKPQPKPIQRVMRVLKALVPSRYIAAIYVMALVLLAFYSWQRMTTGPNPRGGIAAGSDYASLKRYTGYTSGDIVPIYDAAPPGQGDNTVYRGRSYKVVVVYAVYHEGDTKFFNVGQSTRYSQGSEVVPVQGRTEQGPAIICTGHNRYAFIPAPVVERSGFFGIGRKERNKIRKLSDTGADLDTSLYSTDCAPPSEAVLDAARTQFQVYLPPA